jgi:hypothetical protein
MGRKVFRTGDRSAGQIEIAPWRFVVVVVEPAAVRTKISVSGAHGRFLREYGLVSIIG